MWFNGHPFGFFYITMEFSDFEDFVAQFISEFSDSPVIDLFMGSTWIDVNNTFAVIGCKNSVTNTVRCFSGLSIHVT